MVILQNPSHLRSTRPQNHQNHLQRRRATHKSLTPRQASLRTPHSTHAPDQTVSSQAPTRAYEEMLCIKSHVRVIKKLYIRSTTRLNKYDNSSAKIKYIPTGQKTTNNQSTDVKIIVQKNDHVNLVVIIRGFSYPKV